LEAAHPKREEKHFGHLAAFWFGTFAILFRTTRGLVGHGTLED